MTARTVTLERAWAKLALSKAKWQQQPKSVGNRGLSEPSRNERRQSRLCVNVPCWWP